MNKDKIEFSQTKMPNFFIVGAPRAGHTSLYEYLRKVPEIYMPEAKAPGHFFPPGTKNRYDKEKYLALFENVEKQKAIGEASAYMTIEDTDKTIHKIIPNAKIIMILRDPSARAFSHFLQGLRGGYRTGTFEDAFKQYLKNKDRDSNFYHHMIKPGFYYQPVKNYLETFGEKQVKIILFEEYAKDTKKTVKSILRFLGIDSEPPENIDEVYNAYTEPIGDFGRSVVKNRIINKFSKKILSKSSRQSVLRTVLNKKGEKPKISEEDQKALDEIYRDDAKKLQGLLGIKLPWSTLK